MSKAAIVHVRAESLRVGDVIARLFQQKMFAETRRVNFARLGNVERVEVLRLNVRITHSGGNVTTIKRGDKVMIVRPEAFDVFRSEGK